MNYYCKNPPCGKLTAKYDSLCPLCEGVRLLREENAELRERLAKMQGEANGLQTAIEAVHEAIDRMASLNKRAERVADVMKVHDATMRAMNKEPESEHVCRNCGLSLPESTIWPYCVQCISDDLHRKTGIAVARDDGESMVTNYDPAAEYEAPNKSKNSPKKRREHDNYNHQMRCMRDSHAVGGCKGNPL